MIIYQVLPRLWGRGKFSDWQSPAFAYLKSLSADAVWFTGVIRHSSGRPYVKGNAGSPYSIVDYHDVNPYLADEPERRMEEFDALMGRCHEAGLKVFLDYVPNHVSPDCRDVPVMDTYDFDWEDTRKIDYSRREAWDAMLEIALFWASRGVDGLRCDMVELVPRDFLGWLIRSVKAKFPDFTFIAEAYDRCNYHPLIEEAGFDLLYDKSGFYDIAREIICCGRSARSLTSNWLELGGLQNRMLNFLENHDEQRLASPCFAGKASAAYAPLAFGALFNDASFMLYAGQELGEDAAYSPDGRTSIFDFTQVPSLQRITASFSGGKRLPVADSRLLSRYREILSFAPKFAGLRNWDLCFCQRPEDGFDADSHFAFLRYGGEKAWLVFCNFSHLQARVTVRIPQELPDICPLRPSVALEVPAGDAVFVDIL